jgi:hypothetical protein
MKESEIWLSNFVLFAMTALVLFVCLLVMNASGESLAAALCGIMMGFASYSISIAINEKHKEDRVG